MKGVLKNTKAGWFVLYQVRRDELASGYDSIQLHPDSQTWMDGYNLYEGKEVEFDVRVYPSGTRYAKTIDEDDLGCSYPDCICQGNEITDCNNRTPKQRAIMSKVQTPDQVVLGDKTALVENIFHQGLTADEIIDNHLNLVGPTNFDVYSNRDAVKEAMIMFATQEKGKKIMDKEEITVTIYNIIYEQDTTNKKSCLTLSEELYDFIEKLLNENNNGK
jgi:hypothetical protein